MRHAKDVDLHFVNCGSINRISRGLALFRKVNIPVCAIVDLDVLGKKQVFADLINAVDGDLVQLEVKRALIASAITALTSSPIQREEVVKRVTQIFVDSDGDEYLDQDAIDRIRAVMKPLTGWGRLKKYGVDRPDDSGVYVLEDAALTVFNELHEELETLGIFVLRVGELEQFHPDLGPKNKWIANVLTNGVYRRSPDAKNVLRKVEKLIADKESDLIPLS